MSNLSSVLFNNAKPAETPRFDFDPPADEEHAHSPLSETLRTMPSWVSQSVLYVCLLLIAGGLTFASVARMDVVTTAPAVVIPQGRLKPVQTDLEGIVKELLVKEGDPVTAGQPLARIDSSEVVRILAEVRSTERALADVERELEEVLPLKERQTQARVEILKKQIESHRRRQEALHQQLANENKAADLARQLHKLEANQQQELVKRLQLDLEIARRTDKRRKKDLVRVQQLVSRNAASETELMAAEGSADSAMAEFSKLQSRILDANTELLVREVALRTKLNQQEKTVAMLQEELAENAVASQQAELEIRRIEDELALVKLATQQKREALAFHQEQARRKANLNLSGMNSELLDQISRGEASETDRHLVLSPVAGVVGKIAVTDGETAQRGATLMTIIPDGATLMAEVRIPNKEVGRIKEGMTVRYKFDAFPYAKHGAISGEFKQLVKVADDARTVSSRVRSARELRVQIAIPSRRPILPTTLVIARSIKPISVSKANGNRFCPA